MAEGPSTGRKLLFTAVAVAGLLGLVEGLSGAVEWTVWPGRELPLPVPGHHDGPGPEAEAALARGAVPMAEDPELGWALPRAMESPYDNLDLRTNPLGLRGGPLSEISNDARRMLALGDSSIFGDSVQEDLVFHQVAARLLTERGGDPWVAVNGGTPGYDSGQSLKLFERIGHVARPDVVIIGNLWSDVFAGHSPGAQAEHLDGVVTPLRRFATYRVARRLLSPWLTTRQVHFIQGIDDVGGLEHTDPSRVAFAEYVANLRAMGAFARELGAEPVYLILPAPMDFDRVPPPQTILTYRGAMEAVAEELGAQVIDGPAEFERVGATYGFFGDQVHPNAVGHVALGQIVADALDPDTLPDNRIGAGARVGGAPPAQATGTSAPAAPVGPPLPKSTAP